MLHDDIKQLGIDIRSGKVTPEKGIELLCDHCEKTAFAAEVMHDLMEHAANRIVAIEQLIRELHG